MDLARIRSLLSSFLPRGDALSDLQLQQVAVYLDLLLKWNARINLTSVRDAEEIIQRHFGESFFLAHHVAASGDSALDLGSGAGFPGLPLKIYSPELKVSLVESSAKKSVFLNEVIRALKLEGINVLNARAETLATPAASSRQPAANLVTMRAVERFDKALPLAAKLVAKNGTLALLIGAAQVEHAHQLLPAVSWNKPVRIPNSENRVLLIGGLTTNY